MPDSLFLSRLALDLRSSGVRRDLADLQGFHRTVMSGFPQSDGREARHGHGVLYRLEDDTPAAPILLVQATMRPDWGSLPPGYLARRADNPAVKQIALRDLLNAGDVFRFRLAANPSRKIDTKTLEDGVRRHGRRVELRGEVEQVAWLERRGELGGFGLVEPARTLIVRQRGRLTGRKSSGRITAVAVQFDGLLEVTDPEIFHETILTGIGPGKAYGMGLLSLGPRA
jgi:CRISPR system Cascade subunit CasE